MGDGEGSGGGGARLDDGRAEGPREVVDSRRLPGARRVYNIEVEDAHTYFVAGGSGAAGVWVHNQCDSKILAGNLQATGNVRPSNTSAHHIVAVNDPRAAEARKILAREKIDINAADNGIFLPRSNAVAHGNVTVHSTVHTNVYYKAVETSLKKAGPGNARKELAKIAAKLTAGTFPR